MFIHKYQLVLSCLVMSDSLHPLCCSPPAPLSMGGILQARTRWIAMLTSSSSSGPRDRTCVSSNILEWSSLESHLLKLSEVYIFPCSALFYKECYYRNIETYKIIWTLTFWSHYLYFFKILIWWLLLQILTPVILYFPDQFWEILALLL